MKEVEGLKEGIVKCERMRERRNEYKERKRVGICFIGREVRRRENSTVASIRLLPQLPNNYFY